MLTPLQRAAMLRVPPPFKQRISFFICPTVNRLSGRPAFFSGFHTFPSSFPIGSRIGTYFPFCSALRRRGRKNEPLAGPRPRPRGDIPPLPPQRGVRLIAPD